MLTVFSVTVAVETCYFFVAQTYLRVRQPSLHAWDFLKYRFLGNMTNFDWQLLPRMKFFRQYVANSYKFWNPFFLGVRLEPRQWSTGPQLYSESSLGFTFKNLLRNLFFPFYTASCIWTKLAGYDFHFYNIFGMRQPHFLSSITPSIKCNGRRTTRVLCCPW